MCIDNFIEENGSARRKRKIYMKDMYVYILECIDDSFYIGVTNDVGRRFIEHQSGVHEHSYTFSRRPLKLVYCKQFRSPIKAIDYEKQLKGWSRAKKIALINLKKIVVSSLLLSIVLSLSLPLVWSYCQHLLGSEG